MYRLTLFSLGVMPSNEEADRIFNVQNGIKIRWQCRLTITHLDQLIQLSYATIPFADFKFHGAVNNLMLWSYHWYRDGNLYFIESCCIIFYRQESFYVWKNDAFYSSQYYLLISMYKSWSLKSWCLSLQWIGALCMAFCKWHHSAKAGHLLSWSVKGYAWYAWHCW